MKYQIMPMGKIWENGMFSVPSLVAKNYIKLASEYQLKALLLILSNGGNLSSKEIAKTLGCTESDADDFLEFWVDEGVLTCDNKAAEPEIVKAPEAEEKKEVKKESAPAEKALESIPVPRLKPDDVVRILRENPDIEQLLQSAQEVFGRPVSHVEQEAAINMVLYYGLPCEIVLTILQYYKTEKDKKRAIGIAYLGAMAKNWSEEGITTLEAAEEKLRELENSDRLWKEIIALSSVAYRNPTVKQRKMIKEWHEDFSLDMISFACDLMKENADKPTLKYVDSILRNWKKAGIKTLDEAKADNEQHQKNKEKTKSSKLQGKPSFDISEIEKRALYNDDYDI